MKKIISVFSILSVFFLVGCPAPIPEEWTFSLDKYEAKPGDEITINTRHVRAFEPNRFYIISYTKMKEIDGKQIAVLDEKTSKMEFVSMSDSTHATFKVPDDAVTGYLKLSVDYDIEDDSCTGDGIWYSSSAYSDKPLTITQ